MAKRYGTSDLRKLWSPAGKVKTVTIALASSSNGARITVDYRTENVWRQVDQVFLAHGYDVDRTQTGSYVVRTITGGSGSSQTSLHAHGIAVDANWRTGPFKRIAGTMTCEELRKRKLTDWPCAMVDDLRGISLNDGTGVLRWGGDYTSVKDAMHLEVVVSPADLATIGLAPLNMGEGSDLWQRISSMGLDAKQLEWLEEFVEVSTRGNNPARPSSYRYVVDQYRAARSQPGDWARKLQRFLTGR